ncbi:uncharacterized protein L969DRAFT_94239 [Mixia osmundae IAM 14324]|uniref:DDH domain-containing protein n=1 Tax=Mixia osmundae (strain CBS 9802 / IAM 14324 / JCM 22182 / KY 12970) TaxID=764103 RepID=G7E896_MIXOS|nr:uncharacterized protein L969DRAFT_94239 [Mixia osmundae IAM 14324]KEI39160.1 hypothetical protein L969DRAFT_94239 [Mixia osmundae IAM 14324]GAA99056.1 hypothetical protein E5Q_05745 [Mixia osmundae IAM 14324]
MPAKGKRKPTPGPVSPTKKIKLEDVTATDELGAPGKWRDWPAPFTQMTAAREFLRRATSSPKSQAVVIVPDKDADGLSSCRVLYHTLALLGMPLDRIIVHLLLKGTSVFTPNEKARLTDAICATQASDVSVIVVDQGSRPGPPLYDAEHCKQAQIDVQCLIIDHHQSSEWPDGAQVLTACDAQPIATSSLLSYLLCYPLHPQAPAGNDWVAVLGLFGDLGPSEVKFGDPQGVWPVSTEMMMLAASIKRESKKKISDAVGALNAPRRTAEYDVVSAWSVLLQAKSPDDINSSNTLKLARLQVNEEVERCTHAAPKFSKDGRVALLRIDSPYQVHPVIATRWAGFLRAKKLQMIMVANAGHNPSADIMSFSCRICASLRSLPDEERPNLIELLIEYGSRIDGFLDRVGNDFARGHKEATGGIIPLVEFEKLCAEGMEIGIKDPDAVSPERKSRSKFPVQKTTLHSFFKSPAKSTPDIYPGADRQPVDRMVSWDTVDSREPISESISRLMRHSMLVYGASRHIIFSSGRMIPGEIGRFLC